MQVNEEDRLAPQEKSSGGNGIAIAAIVFVVLLSGGAYYYFSADSNNAPEVEVTEITLPDPAPAQPLPVAEAVPEPETMPEPTPVVDVKPEPVTPVLAPLPSLNESDPFIEEKTLELADGMDISNILVNHDMARQFVVFIDNLAQGNLARNVSPLKGPNQSFTVTDITNKTYLDPDSYHRYDIYADFLSSLNEQQLLATYKRLSPLLNQAFGELGYQDVTFKDRLKQAINEMLNAPIVEEPIELSTISVNYQFVDPKLEALPAAQKLLIRMGPDNTRKVKLVLKKLKTQLDQA
ncbi:hypothetical protein NFHSH190041_33780 [Shewanella sp. NFH-SH190041]|uniref:DUF3014 domain-containing protein n=1 Tax=Shewanella sp. NFH-SH190041 TaxID=2950245 RepID=UPI0021C40F0A|nr:DUF3014 domain-containing protein [Shewanella sp. NFH-SH190041]BDM65926.1 hypothetical protein NFHSH190041_33780 [Shewanella sp. NFH-SH190041]